MITETTYAYIAGILDGEGTIHITNQFNLRVSIRNTSKDVVAWMQKIAGEGNIYGDKRRQKTCYSLELCSNKAARFLIPLLPYLKIKKAQAKLALSFQENMIQGRRLTPTKKAWRERCYWKMRGLNAIG